MKFGIQLLAPCLALVALAAPARAEIVDAVVATVDTEVILQSDIMAEIQSALRVMTEGQIREEGEALFNEALEQAIEAKILYREGILNDIPVTDEMVENEIERVRKLNDYETETAFRDALAEDGLTMPEFRERTRKRVVALSMGYNKRQFLRKEAVISEAEIAQYYQDHLDDFQKPERVKLYRIFLPIDKKADNRATVQAQLEAIKEELALGADFSELAKQHSKGPFAADGGFAGWIHRDDLQPQLEEVAFGLAEGDVSPIIETETGMMLLKAAEKVEAGLAEFDEVRTEIEPILRDNYAAERYERWMAELRKRSRVRKYQ